MSIPTDHPFQPGKRVAIRSGYRDKDYREQFVDKTYKTGHFTLKGDSQRWRPYLAGGWGDQPPRWFANPTGDNYSRATVLLWDETADKQISEGLARQKRSERLQRFRTKVERLDADGITEEVLDAIEAAFARAAIAKAEGRET